PTPTLVVWDTATGAKAFTAPAPPGQQHFVAINGDRAVVMSMTWNPPSHTFRAWSVPDGKPVPGLDALTASVRYVFSLSPDGRTMLALAGDWNSAGTPLLVEVDTGKTLDPLPDVPEGMTALRFSADGKWVIGAGGGTKMVTETVPVATTERRTKKGPDGKEVSEDVTVTKHVSVCKMVVSGPSELRVWDAATRRLRAVLPGCGTGDAADVSPDGQLLAVACAGGCSGANEVLLYDLDAARRVLTLAVPPGGMISQVRFAPDGQRLAATDGNAVHLWCADGGRLRRQYDGHGGAVDAVAFSPDGRYVSSFSACLQTGRVWEALTGRELVAASYMAYPPRPMAFTSDAAQVMTPPGFMGTAVYDRATGKPVEWPKAIGRVVAVSPDGTRVVAAPELPKFEPGNPPAAIDPATNRLTVRDAVTGKEVASLDGWQPTGTAAQFTADGKGLILSAPGSGALEMRDGSFKKVLVRHEGATAEFAVSADGRWLATVHQPPSAPARAMPPSPAGTVTPVPATPPAVVAQELRLFDTRTGKVAHTLRGTGKHPHVSRLRFTGEHLIACPGEPWAAPRRVAAWHAATGKLVLEADCAGEPAVSPDGRWLAVPAGTAKAAEVKLFDLSAGKEARSVSIDGEQIGAVAFSADGARVAVGSGSQPGPGSPIKAGAVAVYEAATGKAVHTFRGHSGVVKSVAFSADGGRLVSGGWDGAAKVWDVSAAR
ncbi:MAG: WD40 repeat domain-containing protein, partial [Gemmataceae bacterium]